MSNPWLEKAPGFRTREQIGQSRRCGCYYCLNTFRPAAIFDWTDDGQTALCPYCRLDFVVHDGPNGFPLDLDLLRSLRDRWNPEHPDRDATPTVGGPDACAARPTYDPIRLSRPVLQQLVAEQPYPLLFATVSGAHLYGFPSVNSDYDLRGVHLLPVREVIGLTEPRETIEVSTDRFAALDPSGSPAPENLGIPLEIDLVTHDARKFFEMLLKRNGYVLEQLFSPLVIHSGQTHARLLDISRDCITRHHAHHYLGFSRKQWALFRHRPRVKTLLYTYRVLLTGIHLMRSGEIEANLMRLNDHFDPPHVHKLLALKLRGEEHAALQSADIKEFEFHRNEFERLTRELELARDRSSLPDNPTARHALSELLVDLRMNGVR